MSQLDKKQRHLILFTNFDQLNFVNVNNKDLVKAWVVLYHFRSKPQDSLLFESFSSILVRNSQNKSKGHDLFTNFHNVLLSQSYQNNFRVELSRMCEKTGWPIDIKIQKDTDNSEIALYFLLQEEMCLNAVTGKEEPLALQKLMFSHVRHMRGV